MDLWIRTQNREKLINVAYIDVSQFNGIGEYRLCGDGMFLGKYKSKERSLEVLGEIHEHIERQGQDYLLTDENGIITSQKHYGFVYEMPKE